MATGKNSKHVPENLKKQLALAVRNIQWNYAIFWVLTWGDGYYNGDIKTRKTVQAADLNTDQLGLQRSDQLRELFESLSTGESNQQAKRPTAALSPEDLTDAEWYFLVCMSFAFSIGQGLPGKTFAENRTIWLANAHLADTKVFSRSLLSKAIVCFPHLGGVIELGATDLVPEDPNLIQHIKTSFLDIPSSFVSNIPSHVSNKSTNNVLISETPDNANMLEKEVDQFLDCPDVEICSRDDSSNDFGVNILREESNLAEGVDGEASQIQNWFVDEAISNGLNNSTNSSDCISQTYENPEIVIPLVDGYKVTSNLEHNNLESCQQKPKSGPQTDDIHYQSVLTNLLKSSHQLMFGPYVRNGNKESNFVSWKKDGPSSARLPRIQTPQTLLKKVIFEVPRMHQCRLESDRQKGKKDVSLKEADENDRNHVLSERKRREKINERFMILGSLVPSGGKVDKVSILDHTIEYLKELERKVEELESYKEVMEQESRIKGKSHDAIEQTSDNYGQNRTGNGKRPLTNKRKACEIDKVGLVKNRVKLRDSSTDDITVKVVDKGVIIETKCSWNECVLLEVMETLSKLHLHPQSVQTSNSDGVLSMTIKAEVSFPDNIIWN
ncbi:Basic helix-loop-helix DNA-binding superfamily protein isoform 1 [Dorcoceras hygrometricum]|uniref:Basic helix-loop-helix DNA-binding superfamily protein isoform 1 n=1 Tax=Dorcoceras hygrometricum TaxID=472368 RepID=A0A2Z7BHD0_9LAMI|nr:Basic helix-loop-helix DNA-binding superfamily protein isoform 1 [Dorcoceras hygrometricum]